MKLVLRRGCPLTGVGWATKSPAAYYRKPTLTRDQEYVIEYSRLKPVKVTESGTRSSPVKGLSGSDHSSSLRSSPSSSNIHLKRSTSTNNASTSSTFVRLKSSRKLYHHSAPSSDSDTDKLNNTGSDDDNTISPHSTPPRSNSRDKIPGGAGVITSLASSPAKVPHLSLFSLNTNININPLAHEEGDNSSGNTRNEGLEAKLKRKTSVKLPLDLSKVHIIKF